MGRVDLGTMRRTEGTAVGKIDQFESVFRAASKSVFEYTPVELRSVLVITDLGEYEADRLGGTVRQFLQVIDGEKVAWRVVHGEEFGTVPDLLELVEAVRPDLMVTYRHLHSESWQWPYTLGEYVDVLTQVTTTPVMVLPHPEAQRASDHALQQTSCVMAMTDHLVGDHRLVNWGVRFTEPGGHLHLAHVQDEASFERFMEVIGRIASIDTEAARADIMERLLGEPRDYIESCRATLDEAGVRVTVESVVTIGHRLREYERLIEEHKVDLLVFNTKDEDQFAMHGLAYPLAIELRQIPLLML